MTTECEKYDAVEMRKLLSQKNLGKQKEVDPKKRNIGLKAHEVKSFVCKSVKNVSGAL